MSRRKTKRLYERASQAYRVGALKHTQKLAVHKGRRNATPLELAEYAGWEAAQTNSVEDRLPVELWVLVLAEAARPR